jgi:hypothetical protein
MSKKKTEAPKKEKALRKPPRRKVFVATPMYGGMCTGFYTQSLLMMQMVFMQHGVESALSFVFNESLIQRARNSLVHAFLKTDATHLLFIDADLRFDPHGVYHMLDANKDVICGIYPKKEINWEMVKMAVDAGVPVDQLKHHTGSWVINLAEYAGNATVNAAKPFEIWAGGTGMMLIKRKVFEKLKETTETYVNDMVDLAGEMKDRERIYNFFSLSIEPGTERLLSEDYHFCREWREIGGKIYAAPWLTPGHVGTYLFEGQLPLEDQPQ